MTTKERVGPEILADVQVGDWLYVDAAQADCRCRKVTRVTPRYVFCANTQYLRTGFVLGGRGSQARLATEEDLAAWRKAVEQRKQIMAEYRKQEELERRAEQLRRAAPDLLAAAIRVRQLLEAMSGQWPGTMALDAKEALELIECG